MELVVISGSGWGDSTEIDLKEMGSKVGDSVQVRAH
jgi:hypothetical protein